jgi:Fur family peroxide stress response transcriptional regulator
VRVPLDELAARLARFQTVCRDAGLKLTHQRIEVFREVASSNDHPDAEAVFQGVRERVPTVSLDTVYRTLWLLEDLGLVATLGPRCGRTRFDAKVDSHHHFVCESCGLVRDFENAEFDALSVPDDVRRLGDVSRVHVEVRGWCAECARSGGPGRNRDPGGSE